MDSNTTAEDGQVIRQSPDRYLAGLNAATIPQGRLQLSGIGLRIAELHDELLAWYRCHNAMLPVAFLPPEVLTYIFTCLALVDIPYTRYSRGSLGWIQVTHVCHRWRTLALQSPSLWADFTFLKGNGTETMMERARQVPLRVKMESTYDGISRVLHCIRGRGSQLGLLDLRINTPHRHEAPALEDSLILSACPSLRHLSLKEIFLTWEGLRLSTLVSLKLTYYWVDDTGADRGRRLPTLTTFVSALREMQNLQYLALHQAIRPLDAENTADLAPYAVLPHLSKLSIRFEVPLMLALLQHIDVPLEAEIRVEVRPLLYEIPRHDIGLLLDLLRAHVIAGQPLSIPSIHLRIELNMGHGRLPQVSVTARPLGSLDAAFIAVFPFQSSYQIRDFIHLPELICKLPFAICCSVELHAVYTSSDYDSYNVRQWTSLLKNVDLQLPDVHTLTISVNHPPPLISLLECCPKVMPELESLVIHLYRIRKYENIQAAVEVLSSCISRGLPLKTLELHVHESDGAVIKLMQQHLKNTVPEIRYVKDLT
ncbi:hypothetical protein EVG20_g3127 [Dentipellis fragilis]|uniref:F-box domain-containing protein n=1 Tax=Dentipellis fragilis TaxID=205917 RepID=A0A4Y9Z824_9AGAM|nr:hypothetical protein EVG20_g3127 [Dentipellis fragilis]